MKKIIGLGIIALLTLISNVNAVKFRTIKGKTSSEVPNDWTLVSGSRSIFDIIKVVNSYIRFAVGLMCFLFMIFNGYKLITANGDDKQSKAATTALIKSIIGIAICLLAYIIVNVTVNLFA